MFVSLLVVGFAVVSWTGGTELGLGEGVLLEGISSAKPAFRALRLEQAGQAVRLHMSSEEASVEHPLQVTVSQALGINTVQVPHVEAGFAYSSVERTVCPLQNGDSEELSVHVTSSSPSPLTLFINTSLVEGYSLQLGVPMTFTASPASPAFFVYEFTGVQARVKVRFTSEGSSSSLCSLASVQRSFCPVVELLNNPQHRGTFQSMRSKATIDAQASNASSRLYAVLSVLPTDDCLLTDAVRFSDSFAAMATAGNYDPTPANASSRLKEVTVTVEMGIGDGKYAVAMVVAAVVYLSFYVVALCWIIVFDWWRYRNHPLLRLRWHQKSGEDAPDSGSSDLEPVAAEEGRLRVNSLFKRSPASVANSSFHRLVKRPSLLSVLLGSHLDDHVSKVSSSSLSVSQPHSRPLTSVRRMRSESYPPLRENLGSEGDDEPDTGGSCDPAEEGGTVRRHSTLCKQDSYRKALEDGPTLPGSTSVDEDPALSASTSEDGGGGLKFDCHPLPVNMLLSELPEFDGPSQQSLEYNGLVYHLLAIVVFYSIPAVQLVSTYQQLVTLSGDEDICYFNSLCSHPWQVSHSFTVAALNNIFSNIGYLVLGFLLMLLAYRRRTIYRSFDQLNASREREERVGVPQYFGIYYAIGLALMAEAFMSSVYHICPSKTNYQFDTTFMFVLSALGLYQLLVARSPDCRAGMHHITLLLAAIILVVVVGVVYSASVVFYVLFSVLYLVVSLLLLLHWYYRWQLGASRSRWEAFFRLLRRPSRPKQIPKFVMMLILCAVNVGFAVFAVAVRPADFGSYFLATLLTNFVLALFYYVATKCVYRELPSGRPVLFFALSVLCWGCGVYFYLTAVTDWLQPPAVSRDRNQECILLGFFDAHDCWHFVSAFALFFSFLMVMSLDDRQEDRPRNTLRTF